MIHQKNFLVIGDFFKFIGKFKEELQWLIVVQFLILIINLVFHKILEFTLLSDSVPFKAVRINLLQSITVRFLSYKLNKSITKRHVSVGHVYLPCTIQLYVWVYVSLRSVCSEQTLSTSLQQLLVM